MVATLNALALMVSAYFLITLGPSSGFKSVLVWLPLMILDLGTACYLGYVTLPQVSAKGLHSVGKAVPPCHAPHPRGCSRTVALSSVQAVVHLLGFLQPHKRVAKKQHAQKYVTRRDRLRRKPSRSRSSRSQDPPPFMPPVGSNGQPHDPYATALMIEMGKPYVADEAQQQVGGVHVSVGPFLTSEDGGDTVTVPNTDAGILSRSSMKPPLIARLSPAAFPLVLHRWSMQNGQGRLAAEPAGVPEPATRSQRDGVTPSVDTRPPSGVMPVLQARSLGARSSTHGHESIMSGVASISRVSHPADCSAHGSGSHPLIAVTREPSSLLATASLVAAAEEADDAFVAVLAQRAGLIASRGPTASGVTLAAQHLRGCLKRFNPLFRIMCRLWAQRALEEHIAQEAGSSAQHAATADETAASLKALLLASPELRALRSAFDSLDINDSGTITMRELGHHVKHVLGTRASAGELRAMLGEVDADNDGELKFSDFLLFLAFAAFDTNNTGRITSSSLATAVERMGCMDLLHPDIVNAMVRLADGDGDGLVGMRQFLRVFDFLGLDQLKLA
ncbi:uncharacterized protein HaLaN_02671 [Haematococcus lacustris]|uniref:EF-hand domain-containing protein n=1 Tax=Haematococcus lacustris TaxID=44745 RepID=A0A699YEG0_HAELA|nr:uncharacterized protein HaLaN_02671 [Haematococcus lacustris]